MDIVERFINYTKINTTTDREKGAKGIMPSSPGQMEFAHLLVSELESLDVGDIRLWDNATLTAVLPGNMDQEVPVIAFFGHLDTSAEQDSDTKAQVIDYSGGDICLNSQENIYLKEASNPELSHYRGQRIITTDGTSLLGADDKVAMAAILDALKVLKENPDIKHGPVKVAFLPDEEQGLLGAKVFDVASFGADFAYTIDGGAIGEIVYENWNAGNAVITFRGESAHPMSAKGKLINSLLMAHKFISMLPAGEAPEYTEAREGYYWVKSLEGCSRKTVLKLDIRDFTLEGYKRRMMFIKQLCHSLSLVWEGDRLSVELSDRYPNVGNSLEGESRYPVDIACEAYKRSGIEPRAIAMRGGYDGAVLSKKGLPCPNLFTGAHNLHSVYEYLPVDSLRAASRVVLEAIKITAERSG